MSQPRPVSQLQPVPGFPPAQSYAQYQFQVQQYNQQQAMLKAPPTSNWKNHAMTMAQGFGMGMFVGGSAGLLHGVMTGGLNKATFKRAAGGGTAFGVIFAFGSLIRH